MKILNTLIAVLISGCAVAQGYKIDIKVKGLKDTTAFLAYSYGETTYIRDTAKVNSTGAMTFDNKTRLPDGVYYFVLGKSRVFDFVVSEQQHFLLETSTADYIKNMKVIGDEDNKIFFENLLYNMQRHEEADPFIKVLKDSTASEEKKKEARAGFQKINDVVMAHQAEIIAKYPRTLSARMLKMTQPIEIPEPPKRADGSIDSSFQLKYYRAHFFDNMDLADEAFIHMQKPIYAEKVNEYLDKLFVQTPDSLMAAIEGLVPKVRKNQETYKYLLWLCIYKYQRPGIMGLDEVYVRLNDKYYQSGLMDFWVNDALKKNMKDQAEKLRGSLIGKTGANLIMQDQNFQQKSMYDIKKKYTVLYIFDPDCGHCRTETPKLVDFYNKNKLKFNVEVFAVSTDTSMVKMKNYMKEMKMTWITVNGPRSYVGPHSKLYYAEQTPAVYILDEKKKIIAKGLPVDKMEDFFINYEKFLQRKAVVKPKGT
ncbi:MAG: redoxin domain-containing protein [Cyclobacteriaceae bacterium]|nr:redoxin domain-containing protein [Cyclobacteriaceae bacterium]